MLLAACGRIGFGAGGAADAGGGDDGSAGDDAAPFTEAVGIIDDTFGTNGFAIRSDTNFELSAYAVMRHGAGYLAVGTRGNQSGQSAIALIALTADGQIDPAYGQTGILDVGPGGDDFGYGAVRIDADRIAVNGDGEVQDPTKDDFTLGIVHDNGAPDTGFGTGGFLRYDVAGRLREDTANRLAIVNSTIIACGIGGYNNTDSTFAVARYDFTGALVPSWGANGLVADELNTGSQDECFDVVALGADVITAGRSDDSHFVVVAYRETDGARDTAFATGGMFSLAGNNTRALGVTTVAGDIVAVGQRSGAAVVVRLAPDGTPRASFGNNGLVSIPGDYLDGVVAQPNGKVVVSGSDSGDGIVVRLLADGTPDPAFGNAGTLRLAQPALALDFQNLMLDADGKLLVAGLGTTSGGGLSRAVIARIR